MLFIIIIICLYIRKKFIIIIYSWKDGKVIYALANAVKPGSVDPTASASVSAISILLYLKFILFYF